MQNKVRDAVDTKTIEVADKVHNVTESVNTEDDTEDALYEDALYEEAIDAILEDGDITISEMSEEELEKILEAKFNKLKGGDSLLKKVGKKIGKGIASRVTTSGRADRATRKAEKGEKKIADRERLALAKFKLKSQKALRKAQKAAKKAGKPVPRSYADAGMDDPETAFKARFKKADTSS
jgi:hypothetical protein